MFIFIFFSFVFSFYPNQPIAFQSRSLPTIAYTFFQFECINGTFLDSFNILPPLKFTNTIICPNFGWFPTSMVGTGSNLISGAIGTNVLSTNTFTIELWTTLYNSSISQILVEIGSSNYTSNVIGPSIQFQLVYSNGLVLKYYVGGSFQTLFFDLECTNSIPIPTNRLLYIGITIDGTSNQLNAWLYVYSSSFSLICSDNARSFSSLDLISTSFLRVGGTRSFGLSNMTGFINFLAWTYSTLDASTILQNYESGLPHSLPSVQTITFSLVQRNTQIFDLGFAPYYDYAELSLLQVQYLSVSSNAIIEPFPPGHIYSPNFVNLTYTPIDQYNFSRAGNGPCNLTYSIMSFVASDGICPSTTIPTSSPNCFSPTPATALFCVLDTQDLPFGNNVTLPVTRIGTFSIFTVNATDHDDFLVDAEGVRSLYRFRSGSNPNIYMPQASVIFLNMSNVQGTLYNAINQTSCGTIPLIAGVSYYAITYTDMEAFRYCFRPTDYADESFTTNYQFRDSDTQPIGPIATLTFPSETPLTTCGPGDIISQFTGFATGCMSEGFETNPSTGIYYIPVYINGYDTLGRSLTATLATVPPTSMGTLMLNRVTPLTVGSMFPAGNTTSTNVFFVTANYYFTQTNVESLAYRIRSSPPVTVTQWTNLYGVGFNECSELNFPGCPVKFTYYVTTGTDVSLTATYSILVDGIASGTQITCRDDIFEHSGDVIPFGCVYVDYDQDAFWVGFRVIAGSCSDIPVGKTCGDWQFSIDPGSCFDANYIAYGTMDCGQNCQLFAIMGTPTQLMCWIVSLDFLYESDTVGQIYAPTIYMYKTYPYGLTFSYVQPTVYNQVSPPAVVTGSAIIHIYAT